MQNQKTIIKVDQSVRKEIIEILGTSYPSVRRALNGTHDSELARKIRKVALEKGGVELKPVEK